MLSKCDQAIRLEQRNWILGFVVGAASTSPSKLANESLVVNILGERLQWWKLMLRSTLFMHCSWCTILVKHLFPMLPGFFSQAKLNITALLVILFIFLKANRWSHCSMRKGCWCGRCWKYSPCLMTHWTFLIESPGSEVSTRNIAHLLQKK